MMQSDYVLLSLLGPKPVFWYDEKFDEVFCAWNGIKMTQNHAIMVISSYFFNNSPTPEMRRVADKHFHYLWSMGAFENSESWEYTVNRLAPQGQLYAWYRSKILPVIEKHLAGRVTPQEAFNWLNLKECYNPV